mmetsp:Transcript_13853/g.29252  ORF Transcript_13853/g.29252 Transcript_13853/m.29252 type:complete len:202 (-) Transcript_13853:1539-2144(-)
MIWEDGTHIRVTEKWLFSTKGTVRRVPRGTENAIGRRWWKKGNAAGSGNIPTGMQPPLGRPTLQTVATTTTLQAKSRSAPMSTIVAPRPIAPTTPRKPTNSLSTWTWIPSWNSRAPKPPNTPNFLRDVRSFALTVLSHTTTTEIIATETTSPSNSETSSESTSIYPPLPTNVFTKSPHPETKTNESRGSTSIPSRLPRSVP